MANATVTNMFISGSTAVAAQANQNFSDILTFLNTTGVGVYQPASLPIAAMSADARVPAGVITDFAGAAAPTGWLLCDGSAVSRTTYAALFAAISTTYGAGNGTTTFNLPDLRGRATVGLDNMGGADAGRLSVANTLGGVGGVESANLGLNELPDHVHTGNVIANTADITSASAANHQHAAIGSGYFATGDVNGATIPRGTAATFTTVNSLSMQNLTAFSGALAVSISQNAHTHGLTINGMSGFTGQTAVSRMQPYMLLNKIIRT